MNNDLSRPDVSPQARGKRARSLREALRYSRRALANKYSFLKEGTLQNWEDARFGGLTENGARQLVKAYKAEGLDCREEWLFYGIGPSPFESSYIVNVGIKSHQIAESKLDYQLFVTKKLELFHQYHPNAVDAIVADESMKPGLWIGDHVAGIRYFAEELTNILNTPCIIQTQLGEVLVRVLTTGSQPDRYNLCCTNPSSSHQPILTDVRIFSAAPVLWILRKKNFWQTEPQVCYE